MFNLPRVLASVFQIYRPRARKDRVFSLTASSRGPRDDSRAARESLAQREDSRAARESSRGPRELAVSEKTRSFLARGHRALGAAIAGRCACCVLGKSRENFPFGQSIKFAPGVSAESEEPK